MRTQYWQQVLIWVAHAAAGAIVFFELAAPAWSQGRDPFESKPDPRQEARDPRDVDNYRFDRRGRDARFEAADPLRGGNRDPLEPARDGREVARDTARPALDAVPVPRLPVADDVVAIQWQEVRARDLGLLFDNSGGETILVAEVARQGLMARAGFRPGDRIVSVNNIKVGREMEFIRYLLAEETRDDRLPVVVVRDDVEQTLTVEPALLVERLALLRSDPLRAYGFTVDVSEPERLVVTRVGLRTPAFVAGLRPADVIVAFNDRKPLTVDELAAYIDEAGRDPVTLTVRRGERLTALEWEADITMDSTSSPSTSTTVPDRKRLERMSRLRERQDMLR